MGGRERPTVRLLSVSGDPSRREQQRDAGDGDDGAEDGAQRRPVALDVHHQRDDQDRRGRHQRRGDADVGVAGGDQRQPDADERPARRRRRAPASPPAAPRRRSRARAVRPVRAASSHIPAVATPIRTQVAASGGTSPAIPILASTRPNPWQAAATTPRAIGAAVAAHAVPRRRAARRPPRRRRRASPPCRARARPPGSSPSRGTPASVANTGASAISSEARRGPMRTSAANSARSPIVSPTMPARRQQRRCGVPSRVAKVVPVTSSDAGQQDERQRQAAAG